MEIKNVVSGSFRKHLSEIGIALEAFDAAGIKVLAPVTKDVVDTEANFVILSTDDPSKTAEVLEKEFMLNIEKADFLYVANVGGYIGKSVAAEISLALVRGVPIFIAEDINKFSEEIPLPVQNILKTSVFAHLPIDNINSDTISTLNLSIHTLNDLSLSQKNDLNSLIDNLLNELKHVKI